MKPSAAEIAYHAQTGKWPSQNYTMPEQRAYYEEFLSTQYGFAPKLAPLTGAIEGAGVLVRATHGGKLGLSHISLLMAAPDLLAALKMAVDSMACAFPRGLSIQQGTLCEEQDWDTSLREARAAIAKSGCT